MALAVLAAANECGIPTSGASDAEVIPGYGITGIKERQILLGAGTLEDNQVDISGMRASSKNTPARDTVPF